MVSTRGLARLGMLAVGLGIGAAVAQTPVASADSSGDWLSSIDSLLSGAVPAPATSSLDLAISYDGMTLVSDGTATAYTTPGDYSLAIAEGSDAYASAEGGTGDYALADGTNALALAGGDSGDTGADDDTAIDIGNNDLPLEDFIDDGAYAGNGDLAGGTDSGTGSDDTAIDIGNNTTDNGLCGCSGGGQDGSFAGAGGLEGGSGDGDNDTAIDVGNNSGQTDGTFAVDGNGNYASEAGNTVGAYEYATAFGGNDNTAVADTSYTTDGIAGGGDVAAFGGNDNYASVLGPENSGASADYGSNNVAYVFDPFGSTASDATVGNGLQEVNSDLAAVLLTDGTATVNTAPDMYDILTAFGPEVGTF